MKPIVEVKGLWKEYQRGAQKERYLSLRDSLIKSFKPSAKKESFWALQDINFDVYPGDSLAIIGKNGAGKSTLLKILSRITPPTKGEIILRGRLASLLEVGTGFHAELTGRENIYLNGSILGLGRSEINRQFDAIVDFSGVEAFLDTPLKHYSSGMQLRLAFAVAAHLEPEILVIDEVLAVGDAEFQKKCMSKMSEVSQSGRTIIFVSHNISAIRNLCDKAILLGSGNLLGNGSIDSIVEQYYDSGKSGILRSLHNPNSLHIAEITVNNLKEKHIVFQGDPCTIDFLILNPTSENGAFEVAGSIKDSFGHYLIYFGSKLKNASFKVNKTSEKTRVSLITGPINLKPGAYFVTIELMLNGVIVQKENDVLELLVAENDFYGTGRKWMNSSLVSIEQEWSQA